MLIDGKDMAGVPPWRRHVGMVFQQYAVFPHMNVAANVAYGLGVQGKPRAEIGQRVSSLLGLVGLAGKEKRDVTRLSGGADVPPRPPPRTRSRPEASRGSRRRARSSAR